MRNRTLILIAILIATYQIVSAQDSLGCFKNSIKVSAIPLVFTNSAVITYERCIGHSTSIEIGGLYHNGNTQNIISMPESYLGGQLGVKHYFGIFRLSEERMKLYRAGYLTSDIFLKWEINYMTMKRTYDCFVDFYDGNIFTEDRTFSSHEVGGNFLFGIQIVGRRGFMLEGFTGARWRFYQKGIVHSNHTPTHLYWLVLGVNIGWAF